MRRLACVDVISGSAAAALVPGGRRVQQDQGEPEADRKPPEVLVHAPDDGGGHGLRGVHRPHRRRLHGRGPGSGDRLSRQGELQRRRRGREGRPCCSRSTPALTRPSYDRTEATLEQGKARLTRLTADHNRPITCMDRNAIGREEFDRINGDYAEGKAAVGVSTAARGPGQAEPGLHQGHRADQRPAQPDGWSTRGTWSRPTRRP